MGKELDIHVNEVKRTPGYLSVKRHYPRYIILKLSKVTILKRIIKTASRKKKVTTIKAISRFLSINSTRESINSK